MLINCDVDGVLYPWTQNLIDWFEERYPGGDYPMFEDWSGYKTWSWPSGDPVSREEFNEEWYNAIRAGHNFRIGEPFPGAVKAIHRLTEIGTVRLVTSKVLSDPHHSYLSMSNMVHWLLDNGFPLVPIVFDTNKYLYPADVVIDDKPYGTWPQPGKLNILFAQPWNEEHNLGPYVERIEGWRAVVERIEAAACAPL